MDDGILHVAKPLAIVRDYPALRTAMAARRKELGLTQLEVDDAAGLQQGYCSKLEAGMKAFGPMSLQAMLATVGLELAVIRRDPHPTTIARLPSQETIARRRKWWSFTDRRALPAPEPAE